MTDQPDDTTADRLRGLLNSTDEPPAQVTYDQLLQLLANLMDEPPQPPTVILHPHEYDAVMRGHRLGDHRRCQAYGSTDPDCYADE